MHHLSQSQFRNSSPQPQPSTVNHGPRLPTELLIRVVTVDTSVERANSSYWLHLYKTLQDPITSLLVTHLDFLLIEDRNCGPSYLKRCPCRGYDDALDKAIVSLRNLESLTIHCTQCSDIHSHEYLFDLQAPLLRRFRFCCSSKSSQPSVKSILFLPFMPQVTSLFLDCARQRICPNQDDSFQALVESNDVAPNLHTLGIYGHELHSYLLVHRPIERLCLNTSFSRVYGQYISELHASISQSPGILSHLFAIDVLQWLPRAIEEDLEPYRHLRYIGTVTLLDSEEASTLAMLNLAPLCNLEVMEFNQLRILRRHYEKDRMRPHDMFHPDHGFFEILGDRHPLLRRVLLICRLQLRMQEASIEGGDPVLWEKADGRSWTPRPVPRLDYWDLVHDKLDEV